MPNTTSIEPATVIGLIFVPLILIATIYLTAVLFVWSYARPILPLWLILFFILFPPFFPLLFFYMLFFVVCPLSLATRQVAIYPPVAVVEPTTRGRVRPVILTTTGGNRV